VGDGPPVLIDPLVNRSVVYGSTAYLRVGAVGALPLSYQWRFNGSDLSGATNPVLELKNVRFDQAGAYSVMVRNAFGVVTSSDMDLGVEPFFISAQPQAQNTYRGATVRLGVLATGLEPFSYQWQFNGADISGANASTLVLANAQIGQSGAYSVVVRNPVGSVTSDRAKVSIGQVIAWGEGAFGQTNLPPDLTNVVMVAGGGRHSLALNADGTVVAWGDDTWGSTNVLSQPCPPGRRHRDGVGSRRRR